MKEFKKQMKRFFDFIKLKKVPIGILIGIIIPVLSIPLGVALFYSGMHVYSSLHIPIVPPFIIDYNNEFKLGDLVYWYVTSIGAGVTGVFSYYLLKVSQKNNEIAESMRQKEEERDKREEERDKKEERDNGIIVHYNITHIFKIARELFIKVYDKKFTTDDYATVPTILNNKEWIKNIALISSEIESDEISQLHDIFERAEMIRDLVDRKAKKEDLLNNLRILFENTLLFDVFEYPYLMEMTKHTQKLFKTQLRDVMEHISRIKYKDREIQRSEINNDSNNKEKDFLKIRYGSTLSYGMKEYMGTIENNKFHGKGSYIDTKNKLIIHGMVDDFRSASQETDPYYLFTNEKVMADFIEGRLVQGRRIEFYDDGSTWYIVDYNRYWGEDLTIKLFKQGAEGAGTFNSRLHCEEVGEIYSGDLIFQGRMSKGKFIDGSVILFHDDGNKKYEGSIIEGRYHGEGTEYDEDGNIINIGIFEKGKLKEGTSFIISNTENSEIVKKNFWDVSQKLKLFDSNGVLEIEYPNIRDNSYVGSGIQYYDTQKQYKWYEGEYRAKNRHGRGTEYHRNGRVMYKGDFAGNSYHGNGVLRDEDSNKIYQGIFRLGNFNEGEVFLSANYRYRAKWLGYIKILKMSIDEYISYEGHVNGSTPHGEGKIFLGQLLIFEGIFIEGEILSGIFYDKIFADGFMKYYKMTKDSL